MTIFTFDLVEGGKQTNVTITSILPAAAGIAELLQRLLQPVIVRRMYQQELGNLADYLRDGTSSQAAANHFTV